MDIIKHSFEGKPQEIGTKAGMTAPVGVENLTGLFGK
jgi:hypothetical protein